METARVRRGNQVALVLRELIEGSSCKLAVLFQISLMLKIRQATMQESYKTPTAPQTFDVTDCIAEDLKPRYERIIRAVMGVNQRLEGAGIVKKCIDPTVKQYSYHYKPV